jgi:hypothetical protein
VAVITIALAAFLVSVVVDESEEMWMGVTFIETRVDVPTKLDRVRKTIVGQSDLCERVVAATWDDVWLSDLECRR